MGIFQYEVLNPVIDAKKPYIDRRGFLIIPTVGRHYRYFVEAARYNTSTFNKEYFLLLSDDKFDNNCRSCRVDDYGRLKVKLKGEFAEYINTIAKDYGNIPIKYIETADGYDVWQVCE